MAISYCHLVWPGGVVSPCSHTVALAAVRDFRRSSILKVFGETSVPWSSSEVGSLSGSSTIVPRYLGSL